MEFGGGGFIRKTDVKEFLEMRKRAKEEILEEINNDQTGDAFIKDMFKYELANHEYCITHNLNDTLEAIGLTIEEIENNKALSKGLELARKEYLEEIEENQEEE